MYYFYRDEGVTYAYTILYWQSRTNGHIACFINRFLGPITDILKRRFLCSLVKLASLQRQLAMRRIHSLSGSQGVLVIAFALITLLSKSTGQLCKYYYLAVETR